MPLQAYYIAINASVYSERLLPKYYFLYASTGIVHSNSASIYNERLLPKYYFLYASTGIIHSNNASIYYKMQLPKYYTSQGLTPPLIWNSLYNILIYYLNLLT
jgi:hypothetical protein